MEPRASRKGGLAPGRDPRWIRGRRRIGEARSFRHDRGMRVATLEMDVRSGDTGGNLDAALRGVRVAGEEGAELVALPEMWSTGFVAGLGASELADAAAALDAVAETAAEWNLVVIGSGPASIGGAALPVNRAHVLTGGRSVGGYDKVHLFSPTAETLAFSAGDRPPEPIEVPRSGVRVAPVICYDLRFPAVSRAAFRAGAEVLVVVAQWPEARAAHWASLLRGRAAECQSYVIGCNRIGEDLVGRKRLRLRFPGGSAVVGPDGLDVASVRQLEVAAGPRQASRLSVYGIDPEEVRSLRREVPIARDERRDCYAAWLQ